MPTRGSRADITLTMRVDAAKALKAGQDGVRVYNRLAKAYRDAGLSAQQAADRARRAYRGAEQLARQLTMTEQRRGRASLQASNLAARAQTQEIRNRTALLRAIEAERRAKQAQTQAAERENQARQRAIDLQRRERASRSTLFARTALGPAGGGAIGAAVGGLGAAGALGGVGGIALAATAAAAATAALGAAAIRASDDVSRLRSQIRLVSADVQGTERELRSLAVRTRSSFESIVTVFARTARAMQSLDPSVTLPQIQDFTETVTQLVRISGSSAREAHGALIQLSQGLASNRLGGEELRSVMEQIPAVAIAIAEGMGASLGQLREMAERGELEALPVMRAIASQAEITAQRFATIEPLVSDINQTLADSITRYAAAVAQASGLRRLWIDIATSARDWANSLSEGLEPDPGVYAQVAAALADLERDGVTGLDKLTQRATILGRVGISSVDDLAERIGKELPDEILAAQKRLEELQSPLVRGIRTFGASNEEVAEYAREVANTKAEIVSLQQALREGQTLLQKLGEEQAAQGRGQREQVRQLRERLTLEVARRRQLLEAAKQEGNITKQRNLQLLLAESEGTLRFINQAPEVRARLVAEHVRLVRQGQQAETRATNEGIAARQAATLKGLAQRTALVKAAGESELAALDVELQQALDAERTQRDELLEEARQHGGDLEAIVAASGQNEVAIKEFYAAKREETEKRVNERIEEERVRHARRLAQVERSYQQTLSRIREVGTEPATEGERIIRDAQRQTERLAAIVQQQVDAVNRAVEDEILTREEGNQRIIEIGQETSAAIIRQTEQTTRQLRDYWVSSWRDIGTAIGEAFRDFEDNTEGWVNLLLNTLPKIIEQFKELADARRASEAAGGESGGFLDILKAIIGLGGTGEGRRYGGPVSAGGVYEVGEAGRETFIPNQDGHVFPSGFSGGDTIVNINGVDLSKEFSASIFHNIPAIEGLADQLRHRQRMVPA